MTTNPKHNPIYKALVDGHEMKPRKAVALEAGLTPGTSVFNAQVSVLKTWTIPGTIAIFANSASVDSIQTKKAVTIDAFPPTW